jgi:hypothetical protein
MSATPSDWIKPGIETNSRAVQHLQTMAAEERWNNASLALTAAAADIEGFDQEIPAVRARQIITAFGQALDRIDAEGGQLVISKNADQEWLVGLTWGKEAEDSDMAGAAAYGVGHSADAALIGLLNDLGETV